MDPHEEEFREREKDRQATSFRVSVRTNADREADRLWEKEHGRRPNTTGLKGNEKRRLLNKREEYPRIVVAGETLSRRPVFDDHHPSSSSPASARAGSAPGRPRPRLSPPHHKPSPPQTGSPSQHTLPIRLEARVLERLAGSLRTTTTTTTTQDKAVLGIDYPPRLPTARLELMTLQQVLDDLMHAIRSAMVKYNTVASPIISSHKRAALLTADEQRHFALERALRTGPAATEVDDDVALQLAFDTVLADMIRQAVIKSRRVQSYYLEHVLRVQEDCALQLADMQATLQDSHRQNEALRSLQQSLLLQHSVRNVSQLRARKAELDNNLAKALATSGGDESALLLAGGSVADVVDLCLNIDPQAASQSQYALMARQLAMQLTRERSEGLRLVDGLTTIIREQEARLGQR